MNATVSLPAEEVREMVRAAVAEIAADETRWLSREAAARRVGVHVSTFNRLARTFGIPKSKLNEKVVRFWSADVDAMMQAHIDRSGSSLLEFPSCLAAPEQLQERRTA